MLDVLIGLKDAGILTLIDLFCVGFIMVLVSALKKAIKIKDDFVLLLLIGIGIGVALISCIATQLPLSNWFRSIIAYPCVAGFLYSKVDKLKPDNKIRKFLKDEDAGN